MPAVMLPTFIDIEGWLPAHRASAALVLDVEASALYNGLGHVGSTSGNWREWDIVIPAGTYSVKGYFRVASSAGIVKVMIDGALVGQDDIYHGSSKASRLSNFGTCTVARSGKHTVRLFSDTKNAGSGGYLVTLQRLRFARTSGPNRPTHRLVPYRTAPEIIPIDVFATPPAQSGWNDLGATGLYLNNGRRFSVATSDWIDIWKGFLSAGIYNLEGVGFKYNNSGIITAYLNGTPVGTVDTYSGSLSYYASLVISNIVVPRSSVYTLRLATPTKNSSSSGYTVGLSALQLRRVSGPAIVKHRYPSIVDIDPFLPASRSDIAPTWSVNSSLFYNGYINLSPASTAHYIEWDISQCSGVWTLEIMLEKGSDRAIMTLSIDGTVVGTIDGYSSSTVQNFLGTIANIGISRSGIHTLRLATPTKNASSTNYNIVLQHLRLRRTA